MKKKIEIQVLNIQSLKPIKYKEIKEKGFEFQDDDYIQAGYSEPYVEGDSASDGFYYIFVEREREETDEEYNQRLRREERYRVWAKQRRYESYLKLKKEFEHTDPDKVE